MFKLIALLMVTLSMAMAQHYDVPAYTTQNQNILRSYGNLGQVSTYSKTIDTPFSSVRKADVRVSNPGLTFASPYAHATYAAPLAHTYPASYVSHISPVAPVAHTYTSPYVSHVAPVAPVAKTVAAPAGLLGVAYSAAPAVAHMTYSNGLGVSYAW